jgi:pyrroloquinoline quinone (PQQ) biosynthesis protein C
MAIAEIREQKKLSRQEYWKMVNQVVDDALKVAYERVFSHPFTQELKAGTLPIECIRGWVQNSYAWALEINMSLPRRYYLFNDMISQKTDLLALLADRYADEFATPTRGGHQRTLDALGKPLGLDPKEMQEYQQIPAMRGMLDGIVWSNEVNLQFGVGNIFEEWFGKWCALWYQSLIQHYGLSESAAFYFRLHSEADSFGEHSGGEAIGHEVMGHAEGNRYITVRMLEEGLVRPEELPELVQRTGSVETYINFLDAVYHTYHPTKKLSDVEQTRR